MPPHPELHRNERIGWLRAAVLGANDGLISTSSLLVGVVAAQATREPVLIAGVAGLVAGAISMAAGEYVSVSSQADTEEAELERERHELATKPRRELAELKAIYVTRGLKPELAGEVAEQLMAHDALGAHARDELGLSEHARARPLQAAAASGLAFTSGALPPLALAWLLPLGDIMPAIVVVTPLLLLALGSLGARLGGAPLLRGALRVAFWGIAALGCSSLVGHLFGLST
jgi:VIT1/CCC1 family predicted Fe2+/Mn2+ transporter